MKAPGITDPPVIDRGPLASLPPTLEWVGGADGHLRLLDQTRLPERVESCDCTTVEQVCEAIRALRVRGAPAIGVAAAYGLCLAARPHRGLSPDAFRARIRAASGQLCACRPTAVNLRCAVERVAQVAEAAAGPAAGTWAAMLAEAHAIAREDADACRRIGLTGAHLVPEGGGVLTHCNAGALATVAYGTALSLLYVAHQQGRRFKVYADETRPLLQGARLTAFELRAAGIDVTVLCDGAAASLMQTGRVQLVVVGADRIAANGDVANKIGTYGLALAAREHGVPFYVAAPLSTFDRGVASGRQIPIEERPAEEVRSVAGRALAPPDVACWNPAFDVTPAGLIAGIVTERGIVQPVAPQGIAALFAAPGG